MNRSSFPVQDSTLSAEALAERVLKKYRLPGQITCRFFRKGICDTYRVGAGNRGFFLKAYKSGRRTKLDVTEEVKLLNYLAANGVSVARPVKRRDGMYVNRLAAPEGFRYSVLFRAAPGVQDDGGDHKRIRAFGAMVGRMHQCADKMRAPYRRTHLDMRHLVDDNLQIIAPLMADRQAEFNLICKIGETCKERLSQLLPRSKPEYGICHGDLHGGDVSYDENDNPVLFDFDSSGCGWRALDIGIYLASDKWMDITSEAEDRRQRQLAVFLEGYSRTRALTEAELAAVQLAPPIRHIFLMGHVLRYTAVQEGDNWANDSFVDWHMTWYKHWAENNL